MSSHSSVEDMQMHQTLQAHLNATLNPCIPQQEQKDTQPSPPLKNNIYPYLTGVPDASAPSNVSNELCSGSDWPNPFFKEQMAAATPTSTNDNGFQAPKVKNGIREVKIQKKANDGAGLWVKSINQGIFITFVRKNSPGDLAGLRCGDQILQLNATNVFGHSEEKVYFILSTHQQLAVVVRNRPFEQTITLHKDSRGQIGFHVTNGKISSIVKNSSAERNGLLFGHKLLEINGKDVDGMKDKDIISTIANEKELIINVTILPSFRGEKKKRKSFLDQLFFDFE